MMKREDFENEEAYAKYLNEIAAMVAMQFQAVSHSKSTLVANGQPLNNPERDSKKEDRGTTPFP